MFGVRGLLKQTDPVEVNGSVIDATNETTGLIDYISNIIGIGRRLTVLLHFPVYSTLKQPAF